MVRIINVDKEFLLSNLEHFIEILSGEPHEYWGHKEFVSELPDKWNLSLGAISDGASLLGYIIASAKSDAAHIHKLMVRTEYRSLGIGSILMNEFFRRIGNTYKRVTLKVYEDNDKAIKFYTRHGFTVVGKQEDLLLLEKIL